ncbi:MAG: sugar ABC transporter permease [Clostridiales bacterium]|nr:sugar ABC transporter permease [Clostridiales bacterium]
MNISATTGKSKLRKAESRTAYLCLIPSILGLSIITYIPLIAVFILSFFSWKGFDTAKFVGIANYVRLFTKDPYFYDSIQATVSYAFMAVIGSMLWSLMIAMLLNRKVPARSFFRAVFYLPYVLPAMAVYLGWSWLYDYNHGFFNYIISVLGGSKVMFLDNANMIIPSLSMIAVWLSGNLIVIFIAGLQNVPRIYHEAAEIDGANGWQRFWNITLPCMTPIIFYNLLMALVTNLQVVTPALALTSGGPGNSTTFMSYLMYRYAFINNKLGYSCAISAVFFVLIGIFTGILFATSKSWIFYMGDDNE